MWGNVRCDLVTHHYVYYVTNHSFWHLVGKCGDEGQRAYQEHSGSYTTLKSKGK